MAQALSDPAWRLSNLYKIIIKGDDEEEGLVVTFKPNRAQRRLLARLHRRHPTLTKRDVDVLRGLLQGLDNDALAQRLGLELSSAQTYVKRVHRKLGVNSQRELLGLLVQG